MHLTKIAAALGLIESLAAVAVPRLSYRGSTDARKIPILHYLYHSPTTFNPNIVAKGH